MSPEQQRIAIAEACGWTFDKSRPSEKVVSWLKRWLSPRKSDTNYYFCPDYLNDLNAMHEAEKVINTKELWESYKNQLLQWMTEPVCATAAQRAEAFLLAIGKWEGGEA